MLTDDGLFDGHISTPGEEYYVEPSHRYFPDDDGRQQDFHSVIYRASDVSHPHHHPHHPAEHCASHELHLKRKEDRFLDPEEWSEMASKQSFTKEQKEEEEEEAVIPKKKRRRRRKREAMEGQLFENLPKMPMAQDDTPVVSNINQQLARQAKQLKLDLYGDEVVEQNYWPFAQGQKTVTTYEIVDWADVPESVRHHFRRRANLRAGISGVDPKKKTCMLYLQADHLFYEKMGSEEAAIDVMTRHVQRVNSIYREIGTLL